MTDRLIVLTASALTLLTRTSSRARRGLSGIILMRFVAGERPRSRRSGSGFLQLCRQALVSVMEAADLGERRDAAADGKAAASRDERW